MTSWREEEGGREEQEKEERRGGGGRLSSMQNDWIYSCVLTALQAQQKTPDSIASGEELPDPFCCLSSRHRSAINHVNYLTDGINLLKSQSVAARLGSADSCSTAPACSAASVTPWSPSNLSICLRDF